MDKEKEMKKLIIEMYRKHPQEIGVFFLHSKYLTTSLLNLKFMYIGKKNALFNPITNQFISV